MCKTIALSSKNKGMVLVISLVFLILLCILGLASMQSVNMQEKMAGNHRDHQIAFHSSESALRDGEDLLKSNALIFDGANGLYDTSYTGDIDWRSSSIAWRLSTQSLNTNFVPKFIIEKLPADFQDPETLVAGEPTTDIELYRVTAIGFGQNGLGKVVLQSIYRR